MKIKIDIECESAGQFMQHLLSMYEAGLIYIHERKKVMEDWDETDEFDIEDVNERQVLDDNNCYGHHGVEIVPE